MHRLLQILAVATLTCCWLTSTSAQTPGADPGGVWNQLLLMPAPTPRTAATPTDEPPKEQRPPKFFAPDNPPPDDAPIEDVLEYWNRWADTISRPEPSEVVKQRLFEAV